MAKPPLPFLSGVLFTLMIALLACGNNRSLQSVNISPAVATSSAQFTATGIYNRIPTSLDITATTTWCVGSGNGICVGNAIPGATVTSGMAKCDPGFTGTVTILAGPSGPVANPDSGAQLKPFGAAQLNCP